jgi:hypothetical protein
MKFIALVYTDSTLLNAVPQQEFNATMRDCIAKADSMKQKGEVLDFQQLEPTSTAKSMRVRNGKRTVVDGPFAETKEVLGGFNIIEADNIDEALRLASAFPWAELGCIEVRPLKDIATVRRQVAAPRAEAEAEAEANSRG